MCVGVSQLKVLYRDWIIMDGQGNGFAAMKGENLALCCSVDGNGFSAQSK